MVLKMGKQVVNFGLTIEEILVLSKSIGSLLINGLLTKEERAKAVDLADNFDSIMNVVKG